MLQVDAANRVAQAAPDELGVDEPAVADAHVPPADDFDPVRTAAAIDALCADCAGRSDQFRTSLAMLLKAELALDLLLSGLASPAEVTRDLLVPTGPLMRG